MGVTNMAKTSLVSLATLRSTFSQFNFAEHAIFYWSPRQNCIYYNPKQLQTERGLFQLLHEISHALLGHTYYGSGVELLKMEAAAWQKAQELAMEYGKKITSRQIQDCLDGYRDWLHLRSTCPHCKTIAAETKSNSYHCFNCFQSWTVPQDQRSRHYRMKQKRIGIYK